MSPGASPVWNRHQSAAPPASASALRMVPRGMKSDTTPVFLGEKLGAR